MKAPHRDDILVVVGSLAVLVLSRLLRLLHPSPLFDMAQGASMGVLLLFVSVYTINKLSRSSHLRHRQIASLLTTMALLVFVAMLVSWVWAMYDTLPS